MPIPAVVADLEPMLGPIITRTREAAGVAAIAGIRTGGSIPQDSASSPAGRAWAPPMVIVDEQSTATDVGLMGGNARLWMQEAVVVFRCYGKTRAQADQLARAVASLWHECGLLELGSLRIRNAWLQTIAGAVHEPKLRQPVATVRVRILGAGAPIA